LTPESRDRFLEAVRAGAPLNLAAAHAGFTYAAYARWMALGSAALEAREDGRAYDPAHKPYLEFFEASQRARAAGGMRDFLLVQKAAAGGYVVKETTRKFRGPDGWVTETEKQLAPVDWKAAAYVLDRTHADTFRKPTQVELSGPGGGPVRVAAADVDDLAARMMLHIAAHRDELLPGDDVEDGEMVDDDPGQVAS
jgi:hypothetical protein